MLASSTDGICWNLRTSGVSNKITKITYQNSKYFCLSRKSNDPDRKVKVTGFGSSSIWMMAYGNNVYIAGGATGVLASSTDTIVWIVRTAPMGGLDIGDGIRGSCGIYKTGPGFVVGGKVGRIITSTDAINWVLRSSGFGTSNVGAIAYNPNGNIVADAFLWGTRYSTDAIVWLASTTTGGFGIAPYSIYYSTAQSQFVSAGVNGDVATSVDGSSWVIRTSPSGGSAWFGVRFGNSVWVINSQDGKVATSTDGIRWTTRFLGTTRTGYGPLIFKNSKFISPGYNVGAIISTDGIVWTEEYNTMPSSAGVSDYDGNGQYITSTSTGNELVLFSTIGESPISNLSYSTDAISWELRTSGFGTSSISDLIYNGTNLYVIGGRGGTLAASTDSISWSMRTTGINQTTTMYGNEITSVTYGNNIYVISTKGFIVSSINGAVYTSTDSISWILRTAPFSNSYISSSYYSSNENIFIGGSNDSTFISTDGIVWIYKSSSNLPTFFNGVDKVIRDSNQYILVGGSSGGTTSGAVLATSIINDYVGNSPSQISSSTDGISWSLRTSGYFDNTTLIKSSGSYVFAYSRGLMVSTDNIVWSLRTTGSSSTIKSISYDASNYFAVGNSGLMLTSTDSISWFLRTSGFGTSVIADMIFAGDQAQKYVIVGDLMSSSTDAISWSLRTSGIASFYFNSIDYTTGLFAVAGYNGYSLISTDAIAWSLRTSGFGSSNINKIVYGNNIWIQGGASSTLVSSSQSTLSTVDLGAFLRSSTDTISWITRTTPASLSTINSIGSGGSYIFANGANIFNVRDSLIVSTDNVNWFARTSGFGTTAINAFVYGTLYVAGGVSGTLTASTDTISWTLRTSGFGTSAINSLTYTSAGYVAAGVSGSVRTSTDTISWTVRTANFTTTNINSVVTSGTFYVLSGNSGRVSVASTITASVAGAGGSGTRGGGGGGGGYAQESNTSGLGGTGGPGYVKISWW